MTRLDVQLSRVHHFDEAVAIVCAATRALGVTSCQVVLHRAGGDVPAQLASADGLSLPVIGPHGWFATIVCPGVAHVLERELAMIAMYLSVWCTARGLGAAPGIDCLTPRQATIAQLAALGLTNAEIAGDLGISVNTVKARLKEVYERLAVSSRTELANKLRRPATDPAHA